MALLGGEAMTIFRTGDRVTVLGDPEILTVDGVDEHGRVHAWRRDDYLFREIVIAHPSMLMLQEEARR